jgi:hypothetical protein
MMWLASLLLAQPSHAGVRHSGMVSMGGEANFWFAGAGWRHLIEAGWRAAPDDEGLWSLAAGVRVAPASDVPTPLAAFVGFGIDVDLGKQEPTAGVEIGLSGLNRPVDHPDEPAGVSANQADRVSPVYVAVTASPARFRFGRVAVSVADLRFGQDVYGPAVVFGASYARVEVAW